MMKHFKLKSNGKYIVGDITFPAKVPAPAVILLHGLTNNALDCPVNKDFFQILPKKGYITVQFDFIGCGRSEGNFKDKTFKRMLSNFIDVLEFVKRDRRVTNIGVVGKSSMGVFPIIVNDPRVVSIALLSTSVKLKVQFYRIWKTKRGLVPFGIPATGTIRGPFALTQQFFRELDELQRKCLANLPKIKNIILFWSTADKSAPFEHGHFEYIKKHARKPFRAILIKGVGHGFEPKQSIVINEIINWFDKHLRGTG